MEELNTITDKVINEIQNTETKNIVIETKEILTPEQRIAIDTIRRVKNPFAMIGVKDIMKDLKVCENIAYRIFRRQDFPSINIGKNNQIMLIAYLIWKMSKRVQAVATIVKKKKEKIGSVYYDKKDNKWRCIYYIYKQDTQEETRKTKSFTTEKEAQDFLTSIQYQKGNDLFIKNNGIPLNQLMRENVQRKLDMNLIGERTYARTLETIKKIEETPISKENITDITSTDIQGYLNTLKNYSNSTIKKIKEQFSQTFTNAINKGYIVRNPMSEVIRPKSTQIRIPVRALEIEEQQQFTNYLVNTPTTDIPFKVVYLIQMYLGLRIGEALALRNTDINLHKNLITVNKTLTTDKNHKVIMKYLPKTYGGIREVPIPSFIRREIINQMQIAENNRDKQLFLTPKGEYVRPNNANRQLKTLLEKMEITNITSHSLRHTYGTRCIEAGMRAVALQRLMGHTDIAITLNTYTSVFNKYKEAELEKVNNYYMDNEIINNITEGKVNLYELRPEDWQRIENTTENVQNDDHIIDKPFYEMTSEDFKKLIEELRNNKIEIEKLQRQLKNLTKEKTFENEEEREFG